MTGPLASRALAVLFWVTVAVIYLPIGIMAVFSFSAARYQILPIPAYTTEWYGRVFTDGQYTAGFVNSVLLACSVSLVATLIGFACAYSLVNAHFPGKAAFTFLILAPLAVDATAHGHVARREPGLRINLTLAVPQQPRLHPLPVADVLAARRVLVLQLNVRMRLAEPADHQ